jgi:hypothetical protein
VERVSTTDVAVCSLHLFVFVRSASSGAPDRTDRTLSGCVYNDHSQEFLSSFFEFSKTLAPFRRVDASSTEFRVRARLLTSLQRPLTSLRCPLVFHRLVCALPHGCDSKPKSCRNRSVVEPNDFLQSLALSFIAETSYNALWRGPELEGCLVATFGSLSLGCRAYGAERRRDSKAHAQPCSTRLRLGTQ